MIKKEMSIVICNLKLNMANSKINPNVIENFFILTINNSKF